MATNCVIWNKGVLPNGYGYTHVNNVFYLVHRYFYEEKYGKIQKGMQIDHLCRNKLCVNIGHMEVVTPAENSRRRLTSKLSMRNANKIRSQYKQGNITQKALASLYGVGQDEISRVINMRRWA